MLFELQDEPGTFYMREAFVNQAALDSHCQTDYFQAFAAEAEALLAEPLRLIFMEEVSLLKPIGPKVGPISTHVWCRPGRYPIPSWGTPGLRLCILYREVERGLLLLSRLFMLAVFSSPDCPVRYPNENQCWGRAT